MSNGNSQAKILLVEDSPAHAKLTMMVLSENKVASTVKHVEDGEKALNFLENMDLTQKPDLILLDLKLPGMDGIEVIRSIKNNPKASDIPVVILTTSEAERDIESAYLNSASAYIVKPVDYEVFVNMMDDVTAYWLGWNKRAY